MEKLVCTDCGYENESERVYCHNCGIKLDRSVLPENQPGADKIKRKPPKKRKLNPFDVGKFLANIVQMVIYAALAAGVILAALPPKKFPVVDDEAAMSAPMILMDLEESQKSSNAARRVYTEEQVNAYLQGVIKGPKNPKGFLEKNFRFGRVYTELLNNQVRVGLTQGIFGHELHAATLLRVEIAGGKTTHEVLGGNIGRLKIPGLVMRQLYRAFGNIWDALENEKSALDGAQSIVFEEGRVGIFYKGRSAL